MDGMPMSGDPHPILLERTAAMLVLCDRGAVALGPAVPEGALGLVDLLAGGDGAPTADPTAIAQALRSSDLLSQGEQPDALIFTDTATRDRLAASFLLRAGASDDQLASLLLDPWSEDPKVVPRLRGVAHALLDGRPSLRPLLAERDPLTALGADLPQWSSTERASLVDGLLSRSAAGTLAPHWNELECLDGLAHPGLAEQLAGAIRDRGAEPYHRRLAIDIAEAAGCSELLDDLARLTLDAGEPLLVREEAVHAFVAMADASRYPELRPLLRLDVAEDRNDQLRGTALHALWAGGDLDLSELLRALETPSNPNVYGRFSSFAHRDALPAEVLERYGASGLAAVLRWAADAVLSRHVEDVRGTIGRPILAAALDHLDDTEVRGALVHLIQRAAESYQDLPAELTAGLDAASRQVLVADLLRTPLAQNHGWSLAKLVRVGDLPWLLDLASDPGTSPVVAELITYVCAGDVLPVVERYWADPASLKVLHGLLLSSWSPEASLQRRRWADLERERAHRLAGRREHRPVAVRLEELRALQSTRPLDAWAYAVEVVAAAPGEARSSDPWRDPVTVQQGWAELDDAWHETLRNWAQSAVEQGDPKARDWLPTRSIPGTALAGLLAVELLHADGTLASLPDEVLSRWAPVVMRLWELRGGALLPDSVADLLRSRAPEALGDAARLVLHGATDATDLTIRVREVERFWVPGAERALLDLWDRDDLHGESKQVVVGALVRKRSLQGLERAERALTLFERHGGSRDDAVAAAVAFARLDLRRYWPLLEGPTREDPEFAIAWMQALAWDSQQDFPWIDGLVDEQLALLHYTLVARFPSHEPFLGFRALGPSDFLVMLRDHLQERLATYGTWRAARALEDSAALLPDPSVLRWSIERARTLARERSTPPLTPTEVLRLAGTPTAVVVRGSGALRSAVARCLADFAQRVSWQPYWRRSEDGAFWPRDEPNLAGVVRDQVRQLLSRAVTSDGLTVQLSGADTLRVTVPGQSAAPSTADVRLIYGWSDLRPAQTEREQAAVTLALWFGTERWGAGDDRRAVAARRGAADFAEALEAGNRTLVWDVSVRETSAMVAADLPFGKRLLAALDAEGVTIHDVHSQGADDWHVVVSWPAALRDRFGLAPRGLILATAGEPWPRHTNRARAAILASHGDVDLDLLVIASGSRGLDRQVERLPSRWGQWVPWSFAQESVEPLGQAMARGLPASDVFDQTGPVRLTQFFERQEEVASLRRIIQAGLSVGVYGLRKVGKTSLVRYVTDDLDPLSRDDHASPERGPEWRGSMRVAWVDAQGTDKSAGQLERRLAEQLQRRLAREGGAPTVTSSLGEALDAALGDPERSLCVVIDEYDCAFEPTPSPGIGALLALLRARAQETGRLGLVLIGRDPAHLEEPMLEGAPNPLLAWSKAHWVRPMPPDSVGTMLRTLGLRVGLRVGDATVAAANEWTGGHPMLARQLGAAVQEAGRRSCSGPDTDPVLDEALDLLLDRSEVRGTVNEVLHLLRDRYPSAWSLLLGQGADEERQQGRMWLRRFGLVVRDLEPWRLLRSELRLYGAIEVGHAEGQPVRLEQREAENPAHP